MHTRYLIFAVAVATILGCTNKGHAPGGNSLDMPYITNAVDGGASLAAIGPRATTGASLNSQTCSSCTSDFLNAFSLASTFVLQGKLADSNSCMIAAVSEADIVPGLTDGTYKYLYSSTMTMKVKITASNKTVTSFEIFTCNGGSQIQYMSGTNLGGNVTFGLRVSSSGNFVTMDATGTLSGDDWSSKVLNTGYYLPGSGTYSYFTITQEANYLDISGAIDRGTLGTLDATDVRLVSRAQLLGSSSKTYALGDGSVRTATGANAATTNNWNGDTGVHGGGPTTYDADVAAASLPSIPTTRTSAFTAAETWDCTMGADAINFESAGASNSSFMAAAMKCQEDFQ